MLLEFVVPFDRNVTKILAASFALYFVIILSRRVLRRFRYYRDTLPHGEPGQFDQYS